MVAITVECGKNYHEQDMDEKMGLLFKEAGALAQKYCLVRLRLHNIPSGSTRYALFHHSILSKGGGTEWGTPLVLPTNPPPLASTSSTTSPTSNGGASRIITPPASSDDDRGDGATRAAIAATVGLATGAFLRGANKHSDLLEWHIDARTMGYRP